MKKPLSFLIVFFSCFALVFGQATNAQASDPEAFKPGEMIMEHIGDDHGWHLWGHTSLPLPVIAKHPENGWKVFMSSAFDNHETHEHKAVAHEGFRVWTRKYAEEQGMDPKAYKINNLVVVDANDKVDAEGTKAMIDFSITKNVFALLFSIIVMLILFLNVAKAYRKREGMAPKGLQSLLEPIIIFVRDDIAKANIGHKYEKFMPYLLTIFFFIWINNVLGLIPIFPGGANLTGNIAVPLVMAAMTFVITTINGNKHYWQHIFAMPGVPKPVLILLTPLEIMGMFIKPIVLMIRLFANITAGHIAMLVFFSLIFIASGNPQDPSAVGGFGASVPAVAFTIFLNFLELLVGFIQAYVFTLLSAIYFGMATEEAHH